MMMMMMMMIKSIIILALQQFSCSLKLTWLLVKLKRIWVMLFR